MSSVMAHKIVTHLSLLVDPSATEKFTLEDD
jgi:hypothetical protein